MARAAALAVLAAAVALCYGGALSAPPAFDDQLLLASPKLSSPALVLRESLSPSDPRLTGLDYPYRPLTEMSFSLNWKARPSLTSLRAVNLLMHLAAAAAAGGLAARLACPLPWAAALLFAVHPLGVQAVTYVYQRATLLEALLAFLALGLYLKAAGRIRSAAYAAALLAALLACLAKETGVTVPLLLGAAAWILRGEHPAGSWRAWWPFCLPPLLVAVQVLRATGSGGLPGPGPLAQLAVEMPVVWHYLGLFAWPAPLHFFYDDRAPSFGMAAAAALPLLGLAAWILLGPARHRLPRLGLALIGASLALESSVFPTLYAAAAYRCYPGLLGAGLLFAWALGRLPRPWGWSLGAGILLLLGARTAALNRVWSGREALLAWDVRCAPRVARSRGGLGTLALFGGRPELAARRLGLAVRCPLKDQGAVVALSRTLRTLGRLDEALAASDAAVREAPEDPRVAYEALCGAADWRKRGGDAARLEAAVRGVVRLGFRGGDWAEDFAQLLIEAGRSDEAEQVLAAALERLPEDLRLWNLLGALRWTRGDLPGAEAACRRILALQPASAQAHYNLASLLLRRGEFPGAETLLRRALALEPGHAPSAEALGRMGKVAR